MMVRRSSATSTSLSGPSASAYNSKIKVKTFGDDANCSGWSVVPDVSVPMTSQHTTKLSRDMPSELSLSLYRVQPVAAGCIIGWDAAMPLMQCPPYQYTGAHFDDFGRMTG